MRELFARYRDTATMAGFLVLLVAFIGTVLVRDEDRLWRTARDVHAHTPAFAEDYANVADGLLAAYAALGTADDLLLAVTLAEQDVFFVGLRCELGELERRERARGDRRIGDARRDHASVHRYGRYDLEVDGTQPPADNAERLIQAWRRRSRSSALQLMGADDGQGEQPA